MWKKSIENILLIENRAQLQQIENDYLENLRTGLSSEPPAKFPPLKS